MNNKRFYISGAIVLLGLMASLLLVAALASAQSEYDEPSLFMPEETGESNIAIPAGDQIYTITFPTGEWPFYAQEEIFIHPEPPMAGQPAELCAEVINLNLDEPWPAVLEFGFAPLGIGLPFEPAGIAEIEVPPGGGATGCVAWVPPGDGPWNIQVLLHQPGVAEIQESQRNIDMAEPLEPNVPHTLTFPVANHTDNVMTVSLGLANADPDWAIELSPDIVPHLTPGEQQLVDLIVTPPDELPPDRHLIVDLEAYDEGQLIGGFRKIFRPPVPLHRSRDPFFAESEIQVWPYPPRAGEPTQLCVELFNWSDSPQHVEALFSVADFGIGLPFEPVEGPAGAMIPPRSHETVCITWVPPAEGHFCVQVELFIISDIPYPVQFSQRNLDVAEPLEPGIPHPMRLHIGNFFNPHTNPDPETVTVTLMTDIMLPGWDVQLDPSILPHLAPEEVRPVTMTVTPPPELPMEDMAPVVDVLALAQGSGEPRLLGGIRKFFRPPIPLHPFPDPPYAEREISVTPYPPKAGEPTEVCVDLRNPTSLPQDVTVQFAWAHFGIGLPFTPINGSRQVHLPPHSLVRECLHWIPPLDGQVCLEVVLDIEGYAPQTSRLNLDVNEVLVPELSNELVFQVGNPFAEPVTISMGLIPHLDGWIFELSDDVLPAVAPGSVRDVVLTVTPPGELPLDRTPVVDVEAFAQGELIGGFRKIYRPPVPIHRPKDPIYAESEIFTHPYPPRAQEPMEIGAEIRNPTDSPQTIEVVFSYANFGIGLPFQPVHEPIVVEVPPDGIVRPAITWIPPEGGLWCIQVELYYPGLEEPFYSQRNIDVGEPLEPKTPHARPFPVGNPYDHMVTVTLGMVPHFPGWGLELSADVLPNMAPGEVREVWLTVTPLDDLPGDGEPIVDVEAYAQGSLIGGFRKIFRPPVPVHRPRDPVYAESEIGIDPYPILPGQPTALSVEVFNPTDEDRSVTATFSVAAFGIGLPFSTNHITPNPIQIFVPKEGAARGHVIWAPPDMGGKFCVMVTLEMAGQEPVWSQRNIDVGEPLEPDVGHSLEFPVGNTAGVPVTITLGTVNHRDDWQVALSQDLLTDVQPGQQITVSLTVTAPVEVDLGTGDPIVDVEAYVDGVLIGGFRKLDRPPVPLHKPHEKGYAESEIIIDPYPPQVGVEGQVSTVVQNTSDEWMMVDLEFGWAKFGLGIPFTTTGMSPYTRSVTLGPAMTETVSVGWQPELSGPQCVQIRLLDSDGRYEPQESQRNIDVAERPPCGETKVFTFTVYNDQPISATVDVGMITFNVPADWQVTTIPSDTLVLDPFSSGVVTVTVHIPCSNDVLMMQKEKKISELQQTAGSDPIVDVEGYIKGELVGGIELLFAADGESEKVYLYLPMIVVR